MKHVEKTKNKKKIFFLCIAPNEKQCHLRWRNQNNLQRTIRFKKKTHTSSTLKTLASWLILNCFVIFFSVKSFSLQNTIQFKKAISITHKYIQYFAEKFVFYYRGTSEPFFRVDLLFFQILMFFSFFPYAHAIQWNAEQVLHNVKNTTKRECFCSSRMLSITRNNVESPPTQTKRVEKWTNVAFQFGFLNNIGRRIA